MHIEYIGIKQKSWQETKQNKENKQNGLSWFPHVRVSVNAY
jgi:hypothetical protein